MRPTPYVASLRIYEPLSAFEPADRLRWQSIDIDGASYIFEETLALRRLVFLESPAGRPDGVHILEVEGERYISPWATATRCWAALDNFKDSLPSTVIPFFITPAMEDVITAGVDLLEDKVPHILNETWVIPPRWFLLFQPQDRQRGKDAYGLFTIARTTISLAKSRAQAAHETVVGAFGQGPVEQDLENLISWLEMFHPQSFVELDYGGLATYLDKSLRDNGEDGLIADTSIEDVARSLSGLAAADGMVAGQGYERLMSRWRNVQSLESAN
ncbi:MAG: hypothetical protein O3A27_01725 [Actinomycetota bacterium]|nr:hypothetical protein [Actinomycetota bacterium]